MFFILESKLNYNLVFKGVLSCLIRSDSMLGVINQNNDG
jgi:hypothetical protein